MFCLNYARFELRIPGAWLAIAALVPLLAIGLAATNSQHHLIWSSSRLTEIGEHVATTMEY